MSRSVSFFNTDMLAVNRSSEDTIHASGDSGWSLSIFHCKINSYAKECSFHMYKIVITNSIHITNIRKGKSICESRQ